MHQGFLFDKVAVFSCEFCEISKNTFFHRTHLMAASILRNSPNTFTLLHYVSSLWSTIASEEWERGIHGKAS